MSLQTYSDKSKVKSKNRLKIVDITCIAVTAACIVLCSWLTIPYTVPFTMQTFAVFFALEFLGSKKGFISILIYIMLGAVGLPVFSGFRGGIGHLLGPTGGYIIGFLASAAVYKLVEKLLKKHFAIRITALILCLFVCYAFGTVWFMYVSNVTLWSGLCLCVFPYIVPDVLKILLAMFVAKEVRKAVYR